MKSSREGDDVNTDTTLNSSVCALGYLRNVNAQIPYLPDCGINISRG